MAHYSEPALSVNSSDTIADMNLTDFFINQAGRLRSGWRLLVFLLGFLFTATFFGAIIGEILYRLPIGFEKNSLLGFIYPNFVLLTVSVFVGWLCERFLENLPFRALGCWFTKNWLKDLSIGLVLGAASILFAALIGTVFGGFTFEINSTNGQSAILLTLISSLSVFVIGAAAEEAFFRGYMLQTFTRANLVGFGILLTSVSFATVHNGNSGASLLSWFNTFLAGIWFGAAYLKTRNLWFAFGLHLTWNWFQGAILGINVSGITELTTAPLLRATDLGPSWLTGSNYGIEGGIACTVTIIFSTILIWYLPILRPTEEMMTLTNQENFKSRVKI